MYEWINLPNPNKKERSNKSVFNMKGNRKKSTDSEESKQIKKPTNTGKKGNPLTSYLNKK